MTAENSAFPWQAGLATTVAQEHDAFPGIQGKLPAALQGILYRNGPGRFELGGIRKQHLLDGDGLIQAFEFADNKVRYRSRFVGTPKYAHESQAGHFIYPTWSTLAPGGILANLGNRIQCQAGVTVFSGRASSSPSTKSPFRSGWIRRLSTRWVQNGSVPPA